MELTDNTKALIERIKELEADLADAERCEIALMHRAEEAEHRVRKLESRLSLEDFDNDYGM